MYIFKISRLLFSSIAYATLERKPRSQKDLSEMRDWATFSGMLLPKVSKNELPGELSSLFNCLYRLFLPQNMT